VELRRRSPLNPFESKTVRVHHFQLAFSPLPDMMAAFRASLRDLTLSESSEASSTVSSRPTIGRGRLLQVLGMWFGMAVAVGNAIAAGIVRTPGEIAKTLPNAWLFIGVWVAGGLYALFGASSMAELGTAIPRSGGQYNFSRRALGDYAGFIVGWSDWLSTCGTAVVAIVIAEYSGHLFPGLAGHIKLIAAAIVLGFGILQWRGVRWGSRAQLVTAVMKTAALMILVVTCFILGSHARATSAATTALPSLPAGWPLAAAIVLGLQAIVYTVDGWDGVIYFGEEVRDPGRDIPRAIFGSVFTVMGIYLLLNLVALYVLPMNEIAGNDFVLGTVADRVFGRFGDPIIRSIMIISMLSCVNSNLLFSSRTLHAMSCDGLFFRSVARVNAGGTPALSLFLSTAVSLLFVLGSFERVIAMLSFFFVANYTLTYASLFVLRKREPQMKRAYRAWGYPWTTGIALATSILFLIASIATDRENAPLALAMLVLSYPVFRVLKWASNRESTPA
jgi:APA family basic amino acid/polyamine antiporter